MHDLTVLLREYAELSNKEKAIVADKKKLKENIEALAPSDPTEVDEWNKENGKTEYGSFKLVSQKTWHYSPSVTKLEEDVKILKIEEQESGMANYEEKFGLRFVAPKK